MPNINQEAKKIGTFSIMSVGIGGMIGGGIFAVTGLSIDIAKGAAPIAFFIAGIVALLTGYSYLKLTLAFPSEGGTVSYLNRAYGSGILTGAANILLMFSYVVLVAIYAYAFGRYGSSFVAPAHQRIYLHILINLIIVILIVVNLFDRKLAIPVENVFNIGKLILLGVFIIAGFATPMQWSHLSPHTYPSALTIVAGAMLIFLNYEGFELIANLANEVKNPKRSLPVAFIGGILIVMVVYLLIAIVTAGHLTFEQIKASSGNVLSLAASQSLGCAGFAGIIIAALMATSSAINATFQSTGKLVYIIAKTGELPKGLEKEIRNQHFEGTLIAAALALFVANFIPLDAIATMGSAGFLLIFMMVNIANVKLAKQTGSRAWISIVAALFTAVAIIVLCLKEASNPASRFHLYILVGMIAFSFFIEFTYRKITKRTIHLVKEDTEI